MSDTDSDSEVILKRVSSLKGHASAPVDTEYQIIFKPSDRLKSGLRYTLKQGQELPYAPPLGEG